MVAVRASVLGFSKSSPCKLDSVSFALLALLLGAATALEALGVVQFPKRTTSCLPRSHQIEAFGHGDGVAA